MSPSATQITVSFFDHIGSSLLLLLVRPPAVMSSPNVRNLVLRCGWYWSKSCPLTYLKKAPPGTKHEICLKLLKKAPPEACTNLLKSD